MNGLLLCRTGFDAGLAHRATGDSCLVGRAQDCAIQVMDDALSRHHARLLVHEGGSAIEDLGSSLGTEVNGEAVTAGEPMPLAHFDVIRLGGVAEFVWIELARVPATEVLAAALVGPGGERVPLRVGDNLIGSHEDCDLIVPDPSVAPRHGVLALSPRSLSIRAEAGSPLRVSGGDVTEAELGDGDVLELSPTAEFRVEVFVGAAAVAPAAEQALAATTPHAKEAPEEPVDEPVDEPADDIEGPHSTQEIPAVASPAPVEDPADTVRAPLAAPAPEQATAPWPNVRDTAEIVAEDEESLPDATETAALSIADLEEALREARERQHALAEEASLEDTDSGRVAEIQSATVDLGTSVRRPKVDVAPGITPKDYRAVRREVAFRINVQIPGGESRVTLLREGRHVLGRSEACRVVVPHPSVSREHAEIHVGPNGVRLRDLGSSNGTSRGGKRLADLVVVPGETISFGDTLATFEEI